ncbi:MAG: DNA-binding transcriptional regulator [Planctomycetota bacterium]
MSHVPSVALFIETSNAYARGLLSGVLQYVRSHEPWSLYLPEQERGAPPPDWLADWNGDGIIARIESEQISEKLGRLEVPIVDVSAARHSPKVPFVETNDERIAKLATEHFLQRGFQHFAFCGDPGFAWSPMRCRHFERFVGEAGGKLERYDSISRWDTEYSWTKEKKRLGEWIASLPQPIGIWACYDIKAQQVLEVCREQEIAVPESVAVLGVDNDELVCELSSPPLSSVIPDVRRTGYVAASLLDQMIRGIDVPAEGHFIEPLGVATRQSTDILAIDDDDVSRALQFIRENAWRGVSVAEVLATVPLSRRVLESRFRKQLGRTPHQEIMRLRIERVKQMLLGTELNLASIAHRCGFQNPEYMTVAFRREVGMTPSAYRAAN